MCHALDWGVPVGSAHLGNMDDEPGNSWLCSTTLRAVWTRLKRSLTTSALDWELTTAHWAKLPRQVALST